MFAQRVVSSIMTLAVLLTAGCGDSTGPTDPQTELNANRALWNRSGIVSYRMTLIRTIGSDDPAMASLIGTAPILVEVRDGQVAQRTFAASGVPLGEQFALTFPAVPGLFDRIQQAIDQQAIGLAVRYDETLGFPVSIQIDVLAGAGDEETIRVIEFERIE
jgi:hypothetical protein